MSACRVVRSEPSTVYSTHELHLTSSTPFFLESSLFDIHNGPLYNTSENGVLSKEKQYRGESYVQLFVAGHIMFTIGRAGNPHAVEDPKKSVFTESASLFFTQLHEKCSWTDPCLYTEISVASWRKLSVCFPEVPALLAKLTYHDSSQIQDWLW